MVTVADGAHSRSQDAAPSVVNIVPGSVSLKRADGFTSVSFSRWLSAGDAHDTPVTPGLNPIVFAYGVPALPAYHGPAFRGAAAVGFDTGEVICGASGGGGGFGSTELHGVVSSAARIDSFLLALHVHLGRTCICICVRACCGFDACMRTRFDSI